jgi:hypothetical protein
MGQLNGVSDLLRCVFVAHFVLASLLDPILEGDGEGGGENASSSDDQLAICTVSAWSAIYVKFA